MGFWLAFSGVNCELLGVCLFINQFLGFWWYFDGVLVGLNGHQFCLVYSHVSTDPFLGFWWDFDGVLMVLNGNKLVLVTAMFGGTDPFVRFCCDFDGVEWKSTGFSHCHVWWHWPIFGIWVVFWWGYSCVLIMFYWQPSKNVMGFL